MVLPELLYLYHIQRKLLHVMFIKLSLHRMRHNIMTMKEFPATWLMYLLPKTLGHRHR